MTKCAECGTEIPPRSGGSRYCSAPCRRAYNNRRMLRGAILYDLHMGQGTIAQVNDLISQWLAEDKARRLT